MNNETFFENLQLYGSDISSWPEEIRDEAVSLYEGSAEIRKVVQNERDFESILLERIVEDPSSDLERRITLAAKTRGPVKQSYPAFSGIFDLISLPMPALTLAFVLMFGFSLGFLYDSYADPVETELSEYISFEKGEYYE